MWKETLDSVRDNIVQKTSNPFLATLLFVWVFKNWRLVYGLFNFDSSAKQKDRIDYIDQYFQNISFYRDLADCVLHAFAVLAVTYLLLAISRLIINSYEKIVLPFIFHLTDKSSVVLKSDYQALSKSNETLEGRFLNEREAKVKAQNELDLLEKKVVELTLHNAKLEQLESQNVRLAEKATQFDAVEAQLETLRKENKDLSEKIFNKSKENNELLLKSKQNEELEKELHALKYSYEKLKEIHDKSKEQAKPNDAVRMEKLISLIYKHGPVEDYLNLGKNILNEVTIPNSEFVEFLVGLELIQRRRTGVGGNLYRFTSQGKEIYQFFVDTKM